MLYCFDIDMANLVLKCGYRLYTDNVVDYTSQHHLVASLFCLAVSRCIADRLTRKCSVVPMLTNLSSVGTLDQHGEISQVNSCLWSGKIFNLNQRYGFGYCHYKAVYHTSKYW